MITAEEFFRQKLKEQCPFKEVITLSQELITAEQAMRWAHEFSLLKSKFHVQEALKAKVDAMNLYHNEGYSITEMDAFTKYAYPLENIK